MAIPFGKVGIRTTPAQISLITANTSVIAFTPATGRTTVVRKVHITNRTASSVSVGLGEDAAALGAYVRKLGPWIVPAGLDRELTEAELPNYEFGNLGVATSTVIAAQSTVAGAAPLDVIVQVEVEEFE